MYAACTMQKFSIIDEFILRALQHSIMGVAERERESQIFSFLQREIESNLQPLRVSNFID